MFRLCLVPCSDAEEGGAGTTGAVVIAEGCRPRSRGTCPTIIYCVWIWHRKKEKKGKWRKGTSTFPGNFLKVLWYVPDPNTVDYIV
jgi:hypothetical protein